MLVLNVAQHPRSPRSAIYIHVGTRKQLRHCPATRKTPSRLRRFIGGLCWHPPRGPRNGDKPHMSFSINVVLTPSHWIVCLAVQLGRGILTLFYLLTDAASALPHTLWLDDDIDGIAWSCRQLPHTHPVRLDQRMRVRINSVGPRPLGVNGGLHIIFQSTH